MAIDEFGSGETWRVFRIMSEFVDGFETLKDLGRPSRSSAAQGRRGAKYRTRPPQSLGDARAARVAIISAAAGDHGGATAEPGSEERLRGLNIQLPAEQNRTGTRQVAHVPSLFRPQGDVREIRFRYVIMPGGFGTLDEFFESLTLIQTERSGDSVVLMGRKYGRV